MDLALLVLRLAVGLFFIGHGSQKLWGAFGGHGLAGTAGFFEAIGMRPGRRHAMAAGWAEFIGGALLVLGLFTPFAAAIIISVMLVAIITVHAPNGPWVTENGYEYNVVLSAAVFALAGVGPGAWSLDNAFNLDLNGTGWALIALGIGVLGALGAVLAGRSKTQSGAPATPAGTAADEVEREARTSRTEVEPVVIEEEVIVEVAPGSATAVHDKTDRPL
jgi:putative oxidoreductase